MKRFKDPLLRLQRSLVYSLFLVFPFGQLTRLNFFGPEIKLYLHDLILAALFIIFLLSKLIPPRSASKFSWPPLTKPIFIFSLTALISLLLAIPHYPFRSLAVSSLYLVRWLIYASLYFILSDKPLRSQLKIPLSSALLLSSLALAVFGLAQYLLVPDTRFLQTAFWDDHYYRIIATFGDPGYVAIIYLLGLILLLHSFPFNLPTILGSLLLLASLFLTYSRSTYLALLTAALTLSLIKKKLKPLLLSLIIVLVCLPLLPRPGGEGVKLERLYSISQRFDNWRQGVYLVQQSPLFGSGFNTLRYQQKNLGLLDSDWQTSHSASGLDSSLLFVLATTGVFGFLAYLYLLQRSWQTSELAKLSLSALLIHSLFNHSLFYPWVMIWFWTILAL